MEFGPIWRAALRNKTGIVLIVLQVAFTMAIVINAIAIAQQEAGEMQRPSGVDEANMFHLNSAGFAADFDARLTIVASSGAVLGDSIADPGTMDNHGGRPEVVAAQRTGVGEAERHSATLDTDFLYVAVPIPGTSSERHLEENVAALVLSSELTGDDLALLSSVSAEPGVY